MWVLLADFGFCGKESRSGYLSLLDLSWKQTFLISFIKTPGLVEFGSVPELVGVPCRSLFAAVFLILYPPEFSCYSVTKTK